LVATATVRVETLEAAMKKCVFLANNFLYCMFFTTPQACLGSEPSSALCYCQRHRIF
jgi:hypothetical protein